jgi:uncharacterized membrane protein
MKWVEIWAMLKVIEASIGGIITGLVILFVVGVWLFITITDYFYYRNRTKKKK